jgi:hypothetical protein
MQRRRTPFRGSAQTLVPPCPCALRHETRKVAFPIAVGILKRNRRNFVNYGPLPPRELIGRPYGWVSLFYSRIFAHTQNYEWICTERLVTRTLAAVWDAE